jgi:CHAD domain-containing protein
MEPKFELILSQSLKENMVRMMQEQYENIKLLCLSYEKNPDKNIHEIRKSFKRLRAILRLIKYEIGYSAYLRENSFCRDESKLISDIRDFKVFHENLSNLVKDFRGEIDTEVAELLQEKIQNKKNQRLKEIVQGDVFHKIHDDVSEAIERLKLLRFENEGFNLIRKGLLKTYKKGQQELLLVKLEPSIENYHDLRKRVKYLMYHMQILQPVWTKYFKSTVKMLDKSADQLGLDHDYAELIKFIGEIDEKQIFPDRKKQFVTWLERLRNELQKPALATLEKIYVESSEHFIDRIEQYFYISKSNN